ncbi:hypothetical protein PsYK624_135710 [Phanerochaete sordida]|uniref:Uncharacterized protein n=1 Tax=Phanerochaete sordida TaxID=48140 RepID=A0A9P3GL90_9APHY|nr:hypothetical protein PsYK624_135710 [Phanerochaete sordida]
MRTATKEKPTCAYAVPEAPHAVPSGRKIPGQTRPAGAAASSRPTLVPEQVHAATYTRVPIPNDRPSNPGPAR